MDDRALNCANPGLYKGPRTKFRGLVSSPFPQRA